MWMLRSLLCTNFAMYPERTVRPCLYVRRPAFVVGLFSMCHDGFGLFPISEFRVAGLGLTDTEIGRLLLIIDTMSAHSQVGNAEMNAF